ncbi:thiamine pyrophosphate-dependent enzyme, partial [uncultured Methanobrevibacter sp.]|uniref:thiamine pyrophosphate-dependent enzyme n=1 Tax=uncultured Methanobrevibacter sp. TaxID=253161 RepID=UPI0025E54168
MVGDCQIHGKVEDFLGQIRFKRVNWLDEILQIDDTVHIDGLDDDLAPQAAIKRILEKFGDDIIVSDAGSHTTWTTLMMKSKRPGQYLFPGAMAPMGYSLPGAIGASLATGEQVISINGDGGIQMNIQELATLKA